MVLMRAKYINESVSFERGRDPKAALEIGEAARRDFSDTGDFVKWAYNFPAVWSEGYITSWSKPEATMRELGYMPRLKRIRNRYLPTMVWIKNNVTIEGERLTLKDTKKLLDDTEGYIISRLDRKDHMDETVDFQKGGNPLDRVGIGRVEERRFGAFEDFREWLDKYRFSAKEVVKETWDQPVSGDPEKERLIFIGKTIDELDSKKHSEELDMYLQLIEEIFTMNYWAGEIAMLEYPKYKTWLPEVQEGTERDIEDDFGPKRFLESVLKYFIDKWPAKPKLKNPYESKKH
jgi:hypothetical protein